MAFYLTQVVYKDTAAKSLISHPQTREDAIGKTCKSRAKAATALQRPLLAAQRT
jgi:hypothetical protein